MHFPAAVGNAHVIRFRPDRSVSSIALINQLARLAAAAEAEEGDERVSDGEVIVPVINTTPDTVPIPIDTGD